jgi:hypothetical protein
MTSYPVAMTGLPDLVSLQLLCAVGRGGSIGDAGPQGWDEPTRG